MTTEIVGSVQTENSEGGPSLDDVIRYSERQGRHYVGKYARDLPLEQRDEIIQDARARAWRAFERLDRGKGWRAFIQAQARGAVLDYLRYGKGFSESKWCLSDDRGADQDGDQGEADSGVETPAPGNVSPLNAPPYRTRIDLVNRDDETPIDIGAAAEMFSAPAPDLEPDRFSFFPKWDLVAKLASVDRDVLLVGQILHGYSQEDLRRAYKVSRERLSQRLREFFERLDAPGGVNERRTEAILHAFGLGHLYGQETVDNGYCDFLKPVDLGRMDTAADIDQLDFALHDETRDPADDPVLMLLDALKQVVGPVQKPAPAPVQIQLDFFTPRKSA